MMWLVHRCRLERRNPAYIIISRSSRESNKTFSLVVTVAPLTCRVSPVLNAFVCDLEMCEKKSQRIKEGTSRSPLSRKSVVSPGSQTADQTDRNSWADFTGTQQRGVEAAGTKESHRHVPAISLLIHFSPKDNEILSGKSEVRALDLGWIFPQ